MIRRIPPPISPIIKPKSKGKKAKPKKLKPPPEMEKLDVFLVELEADAGEERSDQSADDFGAIIKSMSKAQLSKLEKRIAKIRDQILEDGSKSKRKKRCNQAVALISNVLENSKAEESKINLILQSKIDQLHISQIETNKKGDPSLIFLKNKKYTINRFIKIFLHSEFTYVQESFQQKKMIRTHRNHGAHAYIKRYLKNYLGNKFQSND